jgi:hypothetical protein
MTRAERPSAKEFAEQPKAALGVAFPGSDGARAGLESLGVGSGMAECFPRGVMPLDG